MVRGAARLYATGGNGAIYYGLGVTEHSQGSTMVMAIANLAMATGNLGREGVGVNPLRGQNNVQGSCDMGSFPHEFSGYRHVSDPVVRGMFEAAWGVPLLAEPGLRIPNMFEAALDGSFKGIYIQGEDPAQSDPDTQHVTAALAAMECVVVQDLFLNETAKYAHVFLPGLVVPREGRHVHQCRAAHLARAEGDGAARGLPGLGSHGPAVECPRLPDAVPPPVRDHGRDRPPDADLRRLLLREARPPRQHPVALQRQGAGRHADDARARVREGKGKFFVTEYVPTDERATRRYPLLLTTGRKLTQYNVGAQTRRTSNVVWASADVVEIHPHDAEVRGIRDGDLVGLTSRSGDIVLPAEVTDRVRPGVVYTTFHFPESGANVVTTENSDWATNCPEYKVTAVEIVKVNQPSAWQKRHREFTELQLAAQGASNDARVSARNPGA